MPVHVHMCTSRLTCTRLKIILHIVFLSSIGITKHLEAPVYDFNPKLSRSISELFCSLCQGEVGT